ncbi:MAG: hypothetical protein PQJ44_06915 [Sphaerochaetaceae bacterium]|nr:hypothetical protein [Sphaerochaetaceae bacterium]
MVDSENELLYLPEYDVIPDNWKEAKKHIVESLTSYAESINAKEIGWYYDVELDTGKKFIPISNDVTSNQWRTIFRKVVDTGTLPNTTTTNTAHGVTVDANFTLIDLYGAATKPTSAFASLPLPFASGTLADNISVTVDATNINITTSKDYTAYTCSYIVLEYIQEI